MILVVDDSQSFRSSVAAFLRGQGFDVVCAANAEEALGWLATSRPDLILLDLVMPGMGGLCFLGRLRADERWAEVPVVVMSAGSDGPHGDQARRLGAKACLVKGNFSLTELARHVTHFSFAARSSTHGGSEMKPALP